MSDQGNSSYSGKSAVLAAVCATLLVALACVFTFLIADNRASARADTLRAYQLSSCERGNVVRADRFLRALEAKDPQDEVRALLAFPIIACDITLDDGTRTLLLTETEGRKYVEIVRGKWNPARDAFDREPRQPIVHQGVVVGSKPLPKIPGAVNFEPGTN